MTNKFRGLGRCWLPAEFLQSHVSCGKLFKAIAQNRIPPRNAANLAFVGNLSLQSLDKLKSECRFKYSYEAWKSMESDAIRLSNPRPSPLPKIHPALATPIAGASSPPG